MTRAITAGTTETRCLAPNCGRKLTSPESIARSYGHGCWRKIRHAQRTAPAGWTPAQQDAAAELIADAAIIPVRQTVKNGTLYQAVSADGTETYLVTAHGCACPASVRGRRCYHVLAARLLRNATRHATAAKRTDYVQAA